MSLAWQLSMSKGSKIRYEIWKFISRPGVTATRPSPALGWTLLYYSCLSLSCRDSLETGRLLAFTKIAFIISSIFLRMGWQNLKLNWNYTIPVSLALVFFPSYLSVFAFHLVAMQVSEYSAPEEKKKRKKTLLRTYCSTDHRSKYFVVKALLISIIPSSSLTPALFMILLLRSSWHYICDCHIILLKHSYPLLFFLRQNIKVISLLFFDLFPKGKINVFHSCVHGQLAKTFISFPKIPLCNFKEKSWSLRTIATGSVVQTSWDFFPFSLSSFNLFLSISTKIFCIFFSPQK